MGSHNLEQSSSQTYSNQTSNQTTLPSTMESIKNTANYVGDKVNEATSGASKEANKNVAKDSDASVGTRASAAKDSVPLAKWIRHQRYQLLQSNSLQVSGRRWRHDLLNDRYFRRYQDSHHILLAVLPHRQSGSETAAHDWCCRRICVHVGYRWLSQC